ncbi:MAG: hypothetical protein ACJ8J0_19480 [Longimicrobiaceae bacterium]
MSSAKTTMSFLLALVLGACRARDVDVAAVSGGVAPFGGMRGVHLGMTARELARVRPAARPEGYTGYVEDVDGFSAAYDIPGSFSEEQVVSPRERVRSVSALRDFIGIDTGMAEWRRGVRTASARLKSSPVCSRIDGPIGFAGLEAEWRRPESSFTATVFELRETQGEQHPARLVLTVTRTFRPLGDPNGRTRIDCNANPGDLWHGRRG